MSGLLSTRPFWCFGLGLVLAIPGYAMKYTVQPGDTLSTIIQRHIEGRIYGKKGNLIKVYKKNQTTLTSPHKLHPGQVIALDEQNQTVLIYPSITEYQKVRAPASEGEPLPLPVVIEKTDHDVKEEDDDEAQTRMEFRAGAVSEYLKTKDLSTAAKSEAVTTSGMHFDLKWLQKWNETLETYINFETYKRNYVVSSDRRLKNPGQTTTGMAIGARKYFKENSFIGLELGQRQEVFLQALNDTDLEFRKISVPKAGVKSQLGLLKKKRLDLYAAFEASALLPGRGAGISSKLGSVYSGGLGINYKKKNGMAVSAEVNYSETNIKSNSSLQSVQRINWLLSISKEF